MSLTETERLYLTTQRLGRVATASASGEPDVAPVTFQLTADGRIEIDGLDNPKTMKWRNVSATGPAAFVVDDLATIDPWTPEASNSAARPAPTPTTTVAESFASHPRPSGAGASTSTPPSTSPASSNAAPSTPRAPDPRNVHVVLCREVRFSSWRAAARADWRVS